MNRPVALLAAALLLLAVNTALFRTDFYRRLLSPTGSTGSFEATVARLRENAADPRRDVLVLGDSRIYSGFDSQVAGAASGGLRFVNGAVPGTSLRCWDYLVRAVDPGANRYRAVVVPVDSYADDDSAFGSRDGDDRVFDLRYLVYVLGLGDIVPFAATFHAPNLRVQAAIDLLLRGPILRDDVQDLLTNPKARFAALAAEHADAAGRAQTRLHYESLAGLRVDFAKNQVTDYPWRLDAIERAQVAEQVLRVPQASSAFEQYRLQWLGAIVRRYRATGTPVVFVRIPTRPAHRVEPSAPSGSPVELAAQGAVLLPAQAYVALERPALFFDHDHLDAIGAERFSRLLGIDVAQVVAGRAPAAQAATSAPPKQASAPGIAQPAVAQPAVTQPAGVQPLAAQRAAAQLVATTASLATQLGSALGIGRPLLFQSNEFWWFFAAIALVFYSMPLRFGRLVLLAASWYFYARWNAWYVAILLALTASDFVVALAVERTSGRRRKIVLALGVAANVAFLGTFKYTNFATGTLAALLHLPNDPWLVSIVVPVGISFHTFQSISYLVDVSRARIRAVRTPLDYALYIAFFPQLLAGPIVRAERFFGELASWQRPLAGEVLRGIGEIALGLVKKTALADQFGKTADAYFGHVAAHPGAAAAWSGALAFAMQIYFDFSGYSDIAIGCARLLGFDFPQNFRRPYLATSISDFWRRWHITFSTWLRDYLYIPLGGSRGGMLETLRNLMVTMLLGGLWHGANWTFVAWGGYYGALLSLERILGIGRRDAMPRGFAAAWRGALTFLLVLLGWVLFRAQSFPEASTVLRAMFAGGGGAGLLVPWNVALAVLALGLEFVAERQIAFARFAARPGARAIGLAALAFALELFASPETIPFVYFKF